MTHGGSFGAWMPLTDKFTNWPNVLLGTFNIIPNWSDTVILQVKKKHADKSEL